MRQETDRAIFENAKAIQVVEQKLEGIEQVVETKLEGIEQMLHEQSLMLHKLESDRDPWVGSN